MLAEKYINPFTDFIAVVCVLSCYSQYVLKSFYAVGCVPPVGKDKDKVLLEIQVSKKQFDAMKGNNIEVMPLDYESNSVSIPASEIQTFNKGIKKISIIQNHKPKK